MKFLQFSAAVLSMGLVISGGGRQHPESEQTASQSGVIRVEAPSVVVDVIVTDKKGTVVRGLQASDFRVYENNSPQKIVSFEPPRATAPAAYGITRSKGERTPTVDRQEKNISSDQASTGEGHSSESDVGQFITLVVDLGDLQPANLKASCEAAVKYLQNDVTARDYVGIYWIGQNNLRLALPFTRDKDRAIDVIRAIAGHTAAGVVTAQERIETEQKISELQQEERARQETDPLGARAFHNYQMALQGELYFQSTFQAKAVFRALRAIAQAFAAFSGRKNVLVFSEGFLHSPETTAQMDAVIDAANRANVTFYVVDAKGLTTGHVGEIMSAENRAAGESVPLYHSNLLGPPEPATETTELNKLAASKPEQAMGGFDKFDQAARIGSHVLTEDLEEIAYDTGGLFMGNQNDLYKLLKKVNADLGAYYTLVYQPSDNDYDGSFRKIQVRLQHGDYRLRYRQGYWAIPPGEAIKTTPAAAQLIQSAQSGSLRPTLSLSMNVCELFSSDGRWAVPLSVSLPGNSVAFVKGHASYRAGVTFVAAVKDTDGHSLGVFQRFLDLEFYEKQYKDFRESPFLLTTLIAIPRPEPVTVQAILQFSDGQNAMASRRVALPRIGPLGPILSSLVLSNSVKQVEDIEPSPGVNDEPNPLRVSEYEIGLPTEVRISAGDKLTLYFGIADIPLDPDTNEPHLRISFYVESGNRVVRKLPEKEIDQLPTRAPARLQVIRQYDLVGLGPGSYTLNVEVEDLIGHSTVTESAPFLIQ